MASQVHIAPSLFTIASLNINGMEKSLQNLNCFMATNKIDVLCVQETHLVNKQSLNRWKQQHSMVCFENFGEKNSRYAGTAILVSKYCQNTINADSQIILENRIQCVKIQHNQNQILIINCYLPSGNSALNIRSRTLTLNVISNFLEKEKFDHLVLAGDFNMVLQQIDKANHLTRHEDHHKISEILKSYSLLDAYRTLYPSKLCFSYTRSNTASRIDRIYVSQSLHHSLHHAGYTPISFSDHFSSSSVTIKLDIPKTRKQKYWKLNDSLLQLSQYHESFKEWVKIWREKQSFHRDILKWWDSFKKFCQKFLLTRRKTS